MKHDSQMPSMRRGTSRLCTVLHDLWSTPDRSDRGFSIRRHIDAKFATLLSQLWKPPERY
jgi:hypothetical protein